MSYQTLVSRYISLTKEFKCAIAIFTEDGNLLHLNEEAMDIIGSSVINFEFKPGRYVGNEDFFENLRRYKTVFTHKALIKAGTEVFKVRGMMHLITPSDPANNVPETYCFAFDFREGRIFGSVTLERIVENSGFVAFNWFMKPDDEDNWHAQYVSNTVSRFGYSREEFYNKDKYWKDIIYEGDVNRLREEFIYNWKSGRLEYTREYNLVMGDGQVIPVHGYIHILVDGNNNFIGAEELIFDFAMESERNASLLFLENVINKSSNIVLVWEYDEDVDQRKIRYVSSNIEKFGFRPSKFKSGEVSLRDYIHPDEREQVVNVFVQYSKKGFTYLSQEFRIVNPKEKVFHVKCESSVIILPDGNKYIEMILTDITDIKMKEQHLLEYQKSLEKKVDYIESRDALLSDMSVVDFVQKDELQTLQSAFSKLTESYNAVIDLDGDPITYPDGPETNMGAFYDMFEKKEYKESYFALSKAVRKNRVPMKIDLATGKVSELISLNDPNLTEVREVMPDDEVEETEAKPVTLIGYPLFVEDKHLATWVTCLFSDAEEDRMAYYVPSLWNICKAMAKYVYSSTIMERESERSKLSEIKARELLDRNSTFRDILRRCNETNDEDALEYVLHKVGEYLKLSKIDIMLYSSETGERTSWYEWKAYGIKSSEPDFFLSDTYFEGQKEAFAKDGMVVFNGSSIPIRYRRALAKEHVRAMVAMPIYTLTMDQQYIIFQEFEYDRDWTDEEISFMQTTASILQGFIQRMRSNVDAHDVAEFHFDFLNLSREYIYIKNLDTGKIIYVNPRLEKILGNVVGKTEIEVFRHSGMHHTDPIESIEGARESKNCMMYHKLFNRAMRVRELDYTKQGGQRLRIFIISEEDK